MAFGKLTGAVGSIHAAALLIGVAGLSSRILGIVRDRLLAGHFGASRSLDIYYAAFQIPDFLFAVFLLGAASAAIIPVLTKVEGESRYDAARFIRELAAIFIAGAGAAWIAAWIAAPFLLEWLAPGFGAEDRMRAVSLTRIMMASPVILGLSNIISAVLQAHRRFLAFALSSICYNAGIIFGILVFVPQWGLKGLAYGVILGVLGHLAVQIPAFVRLGFGFPLAFPSFLRISLPVRKVLILSVPRVVAMSSTHVTSMALVAITSTLGSGTISVFQFANNLRYVPIGVFGVSFAVAAFPSLSLLSIRNQGAEFRETFWGAIRSVLFWILPTAILAYVLRAQIVRLTLGAGNFDWHDTRLTAAVLGIFAVAIIAESLSAILTRSFYALGNTARPLVINVASAAFTIALAAFLVRMWQNPESSSLIFLSSILRVDDVSDLALLGIACAVSLASAVNCLLLFWSMERILNGRFQERLSGSYSDVKDILKMALAAGIAGFVAYGMLRVALMSVSTDRFIGVLWQAALASLSGFGVYAFILWIVGNREIRELAGAVKRRMFRLGILPAEWGGTSLNG